MKNTKVAARRPSYRPLLSAIVCGLLLGVAAATGAPGCSGGAIGGDNLTDDGGTGDDGGGSGGGGDGGGGGGGDDGGQAGYCAGVGPPIVVGDNGGTGGRCTGNVAASAFRYGLCVCQGLSSGAPISVDAFDSSNASATLGAGGSVGCNGNINISNTLSIGGSLQVAGSVNNSGAMVVGVDALVGSSLADDQAMTVGRNVQSGGDVRCNGQLKITGSLTFPTGKTLTANNPQIGSTVRAPVSVAAPCDCTAPFDIAGYVQQRQTVNDNAAIGLDPAKYVNYSGDQTLNLPCGRFYLNTLYGNGKFNLNVTGRTALFIGSDVNLSNAFTVTLGGGGELDLFIKGGLTSSAQLNFGNQATPARVRLYMGGTGNINLSGNAVIGGNIYAPGSSLVPSGTLEVFGSIFVGGFNPSAPVKIHHDIAILNASQECGTPGTGGTAPTCKSCSDCGGQACNGGQCGACNNSSDCCAPLSCVKNKCVYQIG